MSKYKNGNVRCALSTFCVPDISDTLDHILKMKYNYLVCPLVHPRFRKEYILKNFDHQLLPLTRSDLLLSADCWQNYIVAISSKYYNCDSEDQFTQKNAELGLLDELKYASHLSLTAFIIPIRNSNVENFSRIINSFLLNKLVLMNVLISIPAHVCTNDEPNNDTLENETWYWWNKIRNMCEESSKLGLILEITADLPSQSKINRWFSEPIKALIIPTSVFLLNKSGFPVLSKAHQQFVHKFLELDVDIIIEGVNRNEHGIEKYYEYINYLYKNKKTLDTTSKYIKGYEDCLQNPLQPLMDNLESQIYEIFEKDPCKYSLYQKAIAQALLDRVADHEKLSREIIIMVLGAGRGPLIKSSLQAALETDRKVKVFAVEKNQNAINTLLNLKQYQWGDKVDVIACDMRQWKTSIKADIIVSELLGSFGCNELSPECLYSAQEFLKKDGISIPTKYRSFIAPIQSYKIYSEMKKCKEYEYPYEAPYVVLLHNHYRIDEPKPIFEFFHPNIDEYVETERYSQCKFTAKEDSVIHGFAGYFDCNLYKEVLLSIVPQTHSSSLFSWFPMFFPLCKPVNVRANETIVIDFWRKTNKKQVWYEWCLTSPILTPIHNPNGRSYWIGL